ncbi:MAG: GNAT family N-acetyltransferase [Lachnospiraceae bacterium]|nr:GNAT family N-acetyltransferase [Lachnospiraceae bacterium]
MAKIERTQYGTRTLVDIAAKKVEDWDTSGATNIRVSLPSDMETMLLMQKKGFQFADRMLQVTISLSKECVDYKKLIRIQPMCISDRKEEVTKIAQSSFVRDRRFHVAVAYNQEIANPIIADWVEKLEDFYVCTYQERLIGFLALKESEDGKAARIHLAAVDERYRMTGAALSLYAHAVLEGKRLGYRQIEGTISCSNVSVLNLYSFLGGTFSNPTDIYLKEVSK